MRFLWNSEIYGWLLWGLLGRKGRWFLGLSINPRWEGARWWRWQP